MKKVISILLLLAVIITACQPAQVQTSDMPAANEPAAPAAAEKVEQPPEPKATPVPEEGAPSSMSSGASNFVPLELKPEEVGSGPRLTFLHSEYPFTLDPQNTSAFIGYIANDLFDTLVTYEVNWETGIADQLKIKPALAESWDIASDNKSITFNLRKDAKFWDGTPVTAEDVKFSIERALVGRMGWGATQIESGGIFEVDQMEVVDPYTFKVNYPNGVGRFSLRNMGTVSLTIMQKKACLDNATEADPWCVEWIKKNLMGSGPYMLGESKTDEYLILKANKNYWGEPKPYYSEIVFRIVPDSQSRMLLLQNGEAQIAPLTQKEYVALKDDPKVSLFTVPVQQDVAVMRWRPDYPPFDDIKIREAVIKAIPYDQLVQDACMGFCTRVKNLIGTYTFGYYEDPLFETDIEAAKKLVAESKYAGNVPPFEIILPDQSMHIPAAIIIQDSLRSIGIQMNIKQVTGNAFDKIAWQDRDLDTGIHSMFPWWNDFMYWMFWMYTTTSATNHIQYSNPDLDEQVKAALLVPIDNVEEYQKYQDPVINLLIDERLAAPLYQTHWTIAKSKDICDITFWPYGWIGMTYWRSCQ
jgi:peptide/nickel transport system substrate-binding protein